jgi:hypothetical protein
MWRCAVRRRGFVFRRHVRPYAHSAPLAAQRTRKHARCHHHIPVEQHLYDGHVLYAPFVPRRDSPASLDLGV